MIGSPIFSVLIDSMQVERLGSHTFLVATISFALMALSISEIKTCMAFLLFELTVGIYFPTMGTMKSMIVPENERAAIYNLNLVPLNFIVLFSLLTDLTPQHSFMLCTCIVATEIFLQTRLIALNANVIHHVDEKDVEIGTETSGVKNLIS